MLDKQYAFKITLSYFSFGILWILFSDAIIGNISVDRNVVTYISIIKGSLFVCLTTILIYILSQHYIKKLYQTNQSLQTSYADLTAAHEELTAAEEAAHQQFSQLIRTQNQKLALFKAVPDLIILFDKQGVFLDYKAPISFKLFVEPEHFLGKGISELFPSELARQTLASIKQAIKDGDIQFFEYELFHQNEVYYYEARFVKSGSNEVMAIIRDITDKKQTAHQLEYLSLYDALTGVNNRTFFEEEILKIETRNEKNVGVIVCDLDGLKLINDTLGHRAGDDLLGTVADLLKSCISPPDIVARIGGDEFALLLVDSEQQKIADLADAIRSCVERYNAGTPKLPLSLSVGWAASGAGNNIVELFKEADNNMYREKMHKGQSARSAIVQAMMQALEARDYITEGHAERLQTLVEALAVKLKLPASKMADLRLFAQFHDIGKVGIPDNILFKPGRLTADEFAIMSRHSEIGYRIAKSAPDLAPIAAWILQHHEWWNGHGYPLALAGDEIPVECRMLAIADAFDAMTNDRPYRGAMSQQDAIAELRKGAGTQFDPMLVEHFTAMLDEY